jgi:hypothetical protein
VNDCLSGANADNLKVVACTDASAKFKVLGKVDGKTKIEAETNGGELCKSFTGAESFFWKGPVGGTGYVLCLGPIN